MTEHEFADLLRMMLDDLSNMDDVDRSQASMSEMYPVEDAQVRLFSDVGLLTMNEGVIVELSDASEFQLTVVRSK